MVAIRFDWGEPSSFQQQVERDLQAVRALLEAIHLLLAQRLPAHGQPRTAVDDSCSEATEAFATSQLVLRRTPPAAAE